MKQLVIILLSHIVFQYGFAVDSSPANAQWVTVKLYAMTTIKSDVVYLKDISSISGDKASVNKLKQMPLSFKIEGSKGLLNKSAVRDAIKNVLDGSVRVSLYGPETIQLKKKGKRIQPDQMVEAAKIRLLAYLEQHYENPKVQHIGKLKAVTYFGDGRLSVRGFSQFKPSTRQVVWVDVEVGDGKIESAPVWFLVSAEAVAYVATHDVQTGQPVRLVEFDKQVVDVMPYGEGLVEQDLQEVRAVQPIRRGAVLTNAMFRKKFAVEINEPVMVESVFGNVRVFVKAVALESKRVGESVLLARVGSQEYFNGTVLSNGRARVLEN